MLRAQVREPAVVGARARGAQLAGLWLVAARQRMQTVERRVKVLRGREDHLAGNAVGVELARALLGIPGAGPAAACDGRLRFERIEEGGIEQAVDRKSTRLNSSHLGISYAVFC